MLKIRNYFSLFGIVCTIFFSGLDNEEYDLLQLEKQVKWIW